MIYVDWIVDDNKSIIFSHLKYFIFDLIVLITGIFWNELLLFILETEYPQAQFTIILLGIIAILITVLDCLIRINKNKKYQERIDEIKNNGKKITGKIIDVKLKHYTTIWDAIEVMKGIPSFFGDYLYSVVIEYNDSEESKMKKAKTPYTILYLEDKIGCECELYIFEKDIFLNRIEETTTNETIVKDIIEKGDKIPATIIEASISVESKYVTVKFIDPKTQKERTHNHEVYFNPKRLEDNQCTLYKYDYDYYLTDFKVGDTLDYVTDERIKIKDHILGEFSPQKRKLQIIVIIILMILLAIIIGLGS